MSDYYLADDLSGALDAAAAFHATGRRVRVLWAADVWPAVGVDTVIGITTETRNASEPVAAAAVASVIALANSRGGRLRFKKIDSTLRGPVAAEMRALMAALPNERFLFVPANPAAGRTVRDGILLVRGVPVAETEFGRDPVWPAKHSSVRDVLGGVVERRLTLVDAVTEGDLALAVAAMDREGGSWVAVGSSALAGPVAARMDVIPPCRDVPSRAPMAAGPTLLICGSAHPVNREQAAILARERGVPAQEIRVEAVGTVVEEAIGALRLKPGLSLLVEPRRADSAAVVRVIAAVAAELVQRGEIRRLFVTGGETASAICTAIGVEVLEFQRAVEPGLSLSWGEFRGGTIRLAIKPGGFGDAGTWVRAWDALRVQ